MFIRIKIKLKFGKFLGHQTFKICLPSNINSTEDSNSNIEQDMMMMMMMSFDLFLQRERSSMPVTITPL